MSAEKYAEFLDETQQSLDYWTEGAILDFTEGLWCAMKRRGLSRSGLARELGTSPAYITKVLRGNANFTLRTMTKLARALNTVLHLHVADEGIVVRWRESLPGTTQVDEVEYGGSIRSDRVGPLQASR